MKRKKKHAKKEVGEGEEGEEKKTVSCAALGIERKEDHAEERENLHAHYHRGTVKL